MNPEKYIKEARHHFSLIADKYILGPQSIPHITLCQFYADLEIYPTVWQEVINLGNCPQPEFTGFSFIKDHQNPNLWWAEISVSRKSELVNFQNKVTHILKKNEIDCLNDINDLYRPHLTLARIDKLEINSLDAQLLQSETFMLSIGVSDEVGQFTQMLHSI